MASLKDVENRIDEIAGRGKVSKSEVIDSLINHINLKFEDQLAEMDMRVIEDIRGKVLKKLFEKQGNYVPNNPYTLIESFGLNTQEQKLFPAAINILIEGGLVSESRASISLTDKGLTKMKGR